MSQIPLELFGITDGLVVSNVSAADQAVATACSFLFRSLGSAVGVSLVGVLIQGVLKTRLEASLSPEDADRILHDLAQSLDSIKELSPSLRDIVRDSYGGGIQAGFAMCMGFLVMCALSVVWWREKKILK